MTAPLMHDPLLQKRKDEADKLNRRRRRAHDISKQVSKRREGFFNRLALLNAGALTFSVTLLSQMGPHQNGAYKWLLHGAWGLLLIALGACLVRNLSHQHYEFAETAALWAESEIGFIEADREAVTSRGVAYSDSSEPFELNRELQIYSSNQQKWQKDQSKQKRLANIYWRLVRFAEWTAAVTMFGGFLAMVLFAVLSG
jgi:hypothetical protein